MSQWSTRTRVHVLFCLAEFRGAPKLRVPDRHIVICGVPLIGCRKAYRKLVVGTNIPSIERNSTTNALALTTQTIILKAIQRSHSSSLLLLVRFCDLVALGFANCRSPRYFFVELSVGCLYVDFVLTLRRISSHRLKGALDRPFVLNLRS